MMDVDRYAPAISAGLGLAPPSRAEVDEGTHGVELCGEVLHGGRGVAD